MTALTTPSEILIDDKKDSDLALQAEHLSALKPTHNADTPHIISVNLRQWQARLDLSFAYSKIVTIFMTPHQPGGWVLDDYWADGYTETAPPIFPNNVSKDLPTPEISLATHEGIYTNAVVDIEVVYLPAMTLVDGNLTRI